MTLQANTCMSLSGALSRVLLLGEMVEDVPVKASKLEIH